MRVDRGDEHLLHPGHRGVRCAQGVLRQGLFGTVRRAVRGAGVKNIRVQVAARLDPGSPVDPGRSLNRLGTECRVPKMFVERAGRAAFRRAAGARCALAMIGVVLLLGCGESGDAGLVRSTAAEGEFDHSGLAVRRPDIQVISEAETLTLPHRLVEVPGGLIVLDPYGDPKIAVVDPRDGTVRDRFGRSGAGPGEFQFPYSARPDRANPAAVWVGDPNQNRFTRLVLRPDGTIDRDSIRTVVPMGDVPFSELDLLPDSRFLTSGPHESARFRIYDASGTPVGGLGPPAQAERGEPASIAAASREATFILHPSGRYLAEGGLMTGILRIHDLDAPDAARAGAAPFTFEPSYRVGVRGELPSMQPQMDMRYGYLGLAATDSRIFGLFSGRTLGGFGPASGTGRFIHVFDWEGALLEVLELDEAVAGIAVARDGNALHATRWEPVPAVVRIPIRPAIE